jgi:hypothetical protein
VDLSNGTKPDADSPHEQRSRGQVAFSSGLTSVARRPADLILYDRQTVSCPECGELIPEPNEPEHLITTHGYLALSGALMPRTAALNCLWDRVFATGDTQAHERLCSLLQGSRDLNTGQVPYVAALEAELLKRLSTPLAKQRRALERLLQNLRKAGRARAYFWALPGASDSRLRQLGRELLLPEVGASLSGAQTAASEVRGWLEQLCPQETIWNKIQICQRLPRFGADTTAVKQCLRELKQERPVACPECGTAVPGVDLEAHLWKAHRIYQFRGARLSRRDLIDALLAAVCGSQPEADAWAALETLAQEEQGERADAFLANRIGRTLKKLKETARGEALPALAEALAATERGARLALYLARAAEPISRHLALILTARLPPPLGQPLIRAIRPLLGRQRAPEDLQLAATAALLQTMSKEGQPAARVINAFVSRCTKARAVERLRQLEDLIGPSPVVTERCLEIENRIRMSCPRCRVQLQRPEMARHLWSQHQLLLDGRRARQPWRLLKAWLRDYRRNGNGQLLVRCRTLGQYLDPQDGLRRVHRLVLALGIEDVEAREMLLAEARQRRASLCPRCYALVLLPEESVPRPLNQSHGRLSLDGYCVEVSERGLVPRLRIETPDQVIYDGHEPEHWLTRRAAILLAVGPFVALALFLALVLPQWHFPAQGPVIGSLLLALVAYAMIGVRGWNQPRRRDRAVAYAWTRLAPRLHAGHFSEWDARFVTGLVLTSQQLRAAQKTSPFATALAERRARSVEHLLRLTENAVAGGECSLVHLVALKRLEVADQVARGLDPVPAVARAVGRCFAGKPPMSYAQRLLAEWEGSWWTTANLARLRILLCDRAFEAGREVRDLLEAGRLAPALGDVLQTDRPDALARLRLLWSLRPSRPWDRWSQAATIFELTQNAEANAALLRRYPDLLLADRQEPAVYLCGRGVVFQEILFTNAPKRVEARARREFERVDYEVVIGDQRLPWPGDPGVRVRQLDRWFRFYFEEFVPQAAETLSWPAPPGTRPLRFAEAVPCPNCHRLLEPHRGQVGFPVEPVPAT